MNAGRLLAQLTVLAIVVYCCYSAIVAAVPTNGEDFSNLMSNPVSIENPDDPNNPVSINATLDGLDLKLTIKTSLTSHFPQDIDDVYIKVFLGEKDLKILLADVQIGSLQSGIPNVIDKEVIIPLTLVGAYAICGASGEGIKLPIVAEVGFKYFKWAGEHLIDLGIGVKYVKECTFISAVPTVYNDGMDASITVNMTNGDDNLMKNAIDFMNSITGGGPLSMTCGDAEFIVTPGTDSVSFEAHGSDGKSAAQIIEEALAASEDGTITLDSPYGTTTINSENAGIFIDILKILYGGSA